MDYLEPAKPIGWDKKLREIHKDLTTVWNGPRRRWEIHYDAGFGKGPQLAIVVGDGYNYRPLDDRVLATLRAGDSHRIGPKAITEIMEEGEKAYYRGLEKDRELPSRPEANRGGHGARNKNYSIFYTR
jgi:hypothetical protein